MGRMLFAVCVALFASASTASAEDAIDPMAWSKDQWRSDLFHTYASHRDAPERDRMRRMVIRKSLVINDVEIQRDTPKDVVKPKLIVVGEQAENLSGDTRIATPPAHACRGLLVLTWVGDHAEPLCNDSHSRLITIRP